MEFSEDHLVKSKPHPFILQKDRRKGITILSPDIPWKSLGDEELKSQWLHCTNVLWDAEKEGKLERADLYSAYQAFCYHAFNKGEDMVIYRERERIPFALLSSAYLLSLGAINEEAEDYLKMRLRIVLRHVTPKVAEGVILPKKSIQDGMARRLSEILGELQGLEDEFKENIYMWLQGQNIPKQYVADIKKFYEPRLRELQSLRAGTDIQLNEAYSRYSKKQIKKMLGWYEQLMVDLDAYGRLKQTQRKPRARKPKSPIKLVARLQYLPHHEELGIRSIKPESIIGATALWVFDTKTRKLCVYNASPLDKELSVKGTTLLGWEPKISMGKTLRNPTEQLKIFMSGGKVAMKKFLAEIRTKESRLNGRLNKNSILLRAY